MDRRTCTLKIHILLILLYLFAPSQGWSQVTTPADNPASVAITQVLTQQQAAWNQGDIPSFMQGYWRSPELSFSGSSGVSRGWQAVLALYQRNYPDKSAMGHLDFSELEVHLLGDSAALVLGKWHLNRDSGDIGGVFTLVFQHFPEGWRIIHDHTSEVPPSKP